MGVDPASEKSRVYCRLMSEIPSGSPSTLTLTHLVNLKMHSFLMLSVRLAPTAECLSARSELPTLNLRSSVPPTLANTPPTRR